MIQLIFGQKFHCSIARTYYCKFSFLITVLWTALVKILKNFRLTSLYIWINSLIIFRQNFTFTLIFLKDRIEYILNSLPISTKYILILLFSFWKHIQNDLRKSQVEYLTLWINVWDLYDAPRTFWWINFLPQLLIYPVLYRESFRTAWYPM